MKKSTQTQSKAILSFGLLTISVLIFIGSCIIAATDGQGALVFVISAPIIFAALTWTLHLAATRSLVVVAKWSRTLIIAFVVCSFLPVVNAFPSAVVGAVSVAFKAVTGKSPYQWARDRNDVLKMIDQALSQSNHQRIDMREFNLAYDWEQVCIFPPYSTKSDVERLLESEFDLPLYSKISESDSIVLLIFKKDRSISKIQNLSRSIADLADVGPRCIPRAQAVFVRKARSEAEIPPKFELQSP